MSRPTRLINIKNNPMIIYEDSECISYTMSYYNNFWEFELFDKWKQYFPTEGLILDIGANIGSHCVQFKHYFPNIKIWAFEIYLENFLLLKQNTKNLENVNSFNIGIGSQNSLVYYNNGCEGNSGVVKLTSDGVNKNLVLSLDSLIFPEPIKFIKIDIEEHELSAFEGMKNILLKDKPLIWTEDNAGNAVPYLQTLGYNILEKNEETKDYLMSYTI
jgi:FkbM family methyltransferase